MLQPAKKAKSANTRGALYLRFSALAALDPLLRIYVGCASRTIERVDEATLIKYYTDYKYPTYFI